MKIKIIIGIFLLVALCVIGIYSFINGGLFADILYPKTSFGFYCLDAKPPSAVDQRLAFGDKYPQAFNLYFSPPGNILTLRVLKTAIQFDLFVKKPYTILKINEMRVLFNDGKTIKTLCKNKVYTFKDSYYEPLNGWYFLREFADPLATIKLGNVFMDKKAGDEFNCVIEIQYSLDNEPVQIQKLNYRVVAAKGKFKDIYLP